MSLVESEGQMRSRGFAIDAEDGASYVRVRVRGWEILAVEGDGSILVMKPGAPDPAYSAKSMDAAVGWIYQQGDYEPVHADDAIDELIEDLDSAAKGVDDHSYGLPTRGGAKQPYSKDHLALRAVVRDWIAKHGVTLPVATNDEQSEGTIPGSGHLTRIGYVSNQSLSSLRLVSTTGAVRIVKDAPRKGRFREVYVKEVL